MRLNLKYTFFFFILWFNCSNSLFSQNWYPVNFPSDTSFIGDVYTLHEFNDELYVGGLFFFDINGTKTYSIAKWDGVKWDSLSIGIGINPQNGIWVGVDVRAITDYNNELYVGGQFRYAGHSEMPTIAKWDGNNWSPVNTYYVAPGGDINTLQEYNGKLYVGGAFYNLASDSSSITVDCCIARLNGNTWENLPGDDMESVVRTFIYKNDLYVGGGFWTAGGVPVYNVARYDGLQWYAMEQGVDGNVSAFVHDTVNNLLYVGGAFYYFVKSDSTGVYAGGIAAWNGNEWSVLPEILDSGFTVSLTIYHGKLYTGSGSTWLSAWNGKTWEHIYGLTNTVATLGIYHDTLLVGGYFKKVVNNNGDTLPAPGLVRWWTPDYCDSTHAIINAISDTVSLQPGDSIQVTSAGFSNQWEWNFGDGISTSSIQDTSQSPIHIYDSAGIFTLKLRATYGLCPWENDSLVVAVSPVGINETTAKNKIMKIYPNPSRDSFTVEFEMKKKFPRIKMQIADINGKLIFQSEINSVKTEVQTKNWNKGVYFVNLISEGKAIAKERVVVE